MEFGFTEKQEKLRKEVHDFYASELPEDFVPHIGAMNKELQAFWVGLQKKAGAKGYLTPGWPKGYGGLGLSSIEQGIVGEEEAYAAFLWPNVIGYFLAGPATILFGTEEQKKEFIPPITRGETIWFEAFTEPEAGSDEANIQTRAVPDGDGFILNGQKIFISGVYKPDYLYTLARTAATVPKHRGISLFLIPADLPGITYVPLPTVPLGGQNQIFFDNVRVSKKYLLGELNRGFYHAMATFEFERTGTSGPARALRSIREFIQFCKQEKRNGKPLFREPEVRKLVAQMVVDMEVHRLIAWHGQWWFGQREKLGPKPYDLSGFFGKIFAPRHAEAMINITGLYGPLDEDSKWVKATGQALRSWLGTRSLHPAGTIEIFKVILAQRGLGLPRAPRPVAKTDEGRTRVNLPERS